jgi:DnaJ family protein C protein 28
MTRREDGRLPERSLERARRGAEVDPRERLHRWETLAERRIREAIEEGAYDDLPGRGKPLDLRVDPYVDPATRLGHELLRNNGYSLPWIETAKELRRSRGELLARARRLSPNASERERERLRADVDALNRRIRDHNLTVPVPGMTVRRLDLDAG